MVVQLKTLIRRSRRSILSRAENECRTKGCGSKSVGEIFAKFWLHHVACATCRDDNLELERGLAVAQESAHRTNEKIK